MTNSHPGARRLAGKVMLVTGGASGIGAATASISARLGAKLVIADIDEVNGSQVASDIQKAGGEALFVSLDVSNEDEWRRAVAATLERYGLLNVVVNNAGLSTPAARTVVDQTDVEMWNLMMAVNATGVFLGTKHAIAPMRAAGGGSIINVSSIYGIVGSRGGISYHAAKGAVRSFTKAAAVQYAAEGIRVNSVHPGFTETRMTENLHAQPGVREERLSLTPLGRLGVPEDIAWGIIYLASDESRFVTGSELVIDGGMTAQ